MNATMILNRAEELREELIENRRTLHSYAETGFDLPQTGDTSMITLTIVASVFAVSTAALFLVLRHYRKKDDNSNE